jgi:hypothetical protein
MDTEKLIRKNMIEVFRTDVYLKKEAAAVLKKLEMLYPHGQINIDLHDCDKVLRVEAAAVDPELICKIVAEHGFQCTLLD